MLAGRSGPSNEVVVMVADGTTVAASRRFDSSIAGALAPLVTAVPTRLKRRSASGG